MFHSQKLNRKIVLLMFVVLTTVIFLRQIQQANALALDYEMFVIFIDDRGYTINAKIGDQLPLSWTVMIFVNQPVELSGRIRVGGEIEREFKNVKVEFRWTYEHVTPKDNSNVEMRFSLKAKEITKEITWAAVVTKKPVQVPKDVAEWFSPRQVSDMMRSLTFMEIIKITVFALAGVGIAYFCKTSLMLVSPVNGMHFILMVISFFGCYALGKDWSYVPYWTVIMLMTWTTYPLMKTARVRQVMEIQLDERNINIAGIPLYKTESGEEAVALQTTFHALRRTFLHEHVRLKVYGNWDTNWTYNAYTQCFIANTAGILEIGKTAEQQELESGIFGAIRKIFGGAGKSYETIFAIDLGNAHQYDNLTFLTQVDAFKKLNQSYENLMRKYERLNALRKADVQREVGVRLDTIDEIFERPKVGGPPIGVSEGAGERAFEEETGETAEREE